jgi:replicative DNA helicase
MSKAFAEDAVLGCCMASPTAYWQVADLLDPSDFTVSANRSLYGEIQRRAREGLEFDPVMIAEDRPDLGDHAYALTTNEGWRGRAVRAYAERVHETAMGRRVRAAGAEIAHLDGDDILGQAQRLIGDCAGRVVTGMRHISEFARESFEDISAKLASSEDLTGIPTGLAELDDLTAGLQPSDLIVIAARPSVGKTAFALKLVRSAAQHCKYKAPDGSRRHVAVFSLEMSGKKLNDRLTAALGRFDAKLLRRPKLMREEDWPRWTAGTTLLADLPILINDCHSITIERLCASIRQTHAVTPLAMVVIDYLQLIIPPKAENKNEAVGIMTRMLKGLAKELDIPIVLLSQLNRDAEGKRPTMATLRDSGAIEQDADVIMFIHRPNPDVRSFLELLLAKQRDGEVGELALDVNLAHQEFSVATSIPPSVNSNARTSADMLWDEIPEEMYP